MEESIKLLLLVIVTQKASARGGEGEKAVGVGVMSDMEVNLEEAEALQPPQALARYLELPYWTVGAVRTMVVSIEMNWLMLFGRMNMQF